MRLVYLSHPIAADHGIHTVREHVVMARGFLGCLEAELARRRLPWAPIAPYVGLLAALDYRETPGGRDRGIAADRVIVGRCDALVLCGWQITEGMRAEMDAAAAAEVRIITMIGYPPLVAAERIADVLEGRRRDDDTGDTGTHETPAADARGAGGTPACQAGIADPGGEAAADGEAEP